MAMIRVGLGAEEAVTGTPPTAPPAPTPPPPPPSKVDQFLAGAKTWLTPKDIPAAMKAVFDPAAWKAAPMVLVGLLAVPAVLLAVVLGVSEVRKRRKNPRRRKRARARVANPRRRARSTAPRRRRRGNPTRKAAHDYQVVVGNIGRVYSGRNGFTAYQTYRTYVGQSNGVRGRAAGEDVVLFKDGEIVQEHLGRQQNPSAESTRRKIRARRRKNPRFQAVAHGSHKGWWAVYDHDAKRFAGPPSRNYHAQVKLAGRMNQDEPSYAVQKKAAARARREIR